MIYSTPLLEYFRRGDVPIDVRLLAAQGVMAPKAHEQLHLLMLLVDDSDKSVAATAALTLQRIPRASLAAFLARKDVPDDVRTFFAGLGIHAADVGGADASAPLIEEAVVLPDAGAAEGEVPAGEAEAARALPISMLPITDKIKLAMRGTREHRSQLVRDSNKLVAVSVLASPKLTETEVETFARMGNVSEEVLRIIGTNRAWVKNYGVMHALAKNPKTPLSISIHLVPHLNIKDVKRMAMDRNLPEQVRLSARKIMSKYTPH